MMMMTSTDEVLSSFVGTIINIKKPRWEILIEGRQLVFERGAGERGERKVGGGETDGKVERSGLERNLRWWGKRPRTRDGKRKCKGGRRQGPEEFLNGKCNRRILVCGGLAKVGELGVGYATGFHLSAHVGAGPDPCYGRDVTDGYQGPRSLQAAQGDD